MAYDFLAQYPIWILGTVAALIAGLATGVGAIPIFFTRNISLKVQDIVMGFGAGVMLAATSFSLIIPALDSVDVKIKGALIVVTGILLGGIFLYLADKYIPHNHFIKGHEGLDLFKVKRIWLFVLAITLHNFPEGLAVGVGFGGGNISNGLSLAIGIGLQNIPEGLVVALSLITLNYKVKKAFLIALLTGLVEPIGGLLGAGIVSIFQPILPWALAFAAGAMLFVISDEIIPETHRKGHAKQATLGLMIGFIVMLFLDVVLG
jgi:zinc transporter, ZIP family